MEGMKSISQITGLAIAVVVVLGCLSMGSRSTSPAKADGADNVAWALSAFCSHLAASGEPAGVEIQVVNRFQDTIDLVSLHLLVDDGMTGEDAIADDERSRALFLSFGSTAPFEAPPNSHCLWEGIDSARHTRKGVYLVRLSPIIDNPYSTSRSFSEGLFLEISLGGVAGEVYWIARTPSAVLPQQISVIRLDVDDVTGLG